MTNTCSHVKYLIKQIAFVNQNKYLHMRPEHTAIQPYFKTKITFNTAYNTKIQK